MCSILLTIKRPKCYTGCARRNKVGIVPESGQSRIPKANIKAGAQPCGRINGTLYVFDAYGASFIKKDGSGQKIRSIDYGFELMVEKCRSSDDKLKIDYQVMTSEGKIDRFIDECSISQSGHTPEDYMHQHDFFELMLVLDGEIDVTIESATHTFRKGDACLINLSVRHLENFVNCAWNVASLCFSRETAAEIIADLSGYSPVTGLCRFLEEGVHKDAAFRKNYLEFRVQDGVSDVENQTTRLFLQALIRELTQKDPGYSHMSYALILRMLSSLADSDLYRLDSFEIEYSAQDYILEQVKDYLDSLNGSTDFSRLAAALHYNADYLNKVIKAKTGQTLTEYARARRLSRAAKLIR